ncbi:DUF692 family multinuclear iron-containing protein [Spirosoma sp. SC4-14]|uniref:multinuclear nonheme iron-dependent oxidase n=1 Tax=Spirosoma sp. SC4-14 TaxID=3128900 RepID=UPI0030CD1DF2
MAVIRSSIACNLESNVLAASIPLFESERVQAIEWSFDTLYQQEQLPEWFIELLTAFGRENRLIGHGVFFSLFSGKWLPQQQEWLVWLNAVSNQYTFDHITEHFGFLTGKDFHRGAPLSVPFTASTLALGQDRLRRLQHACQCPVGLENLAFAYTPDDVKMHGEFLNRLLEPVNGFIILDLHNFYCQLHNFNLAVDELLRLYPLDRVREIHLSGGSWSESLSKPEQKIRRDTHDGAVPASVFELLETAIPLCPNLRYVVLEQLGVSLATETSRAQFQRDFFRMDAIIRACEQQRNKTDLQLFSPGFLFNFDQTPIEDDDLHEQQRELSQILESADDYQQAADQLAKSSLANSDWHIELWEPHMLETAIAIARKWKNGFT